MSTTSQPTKIRPSRLTLAAMTVFGLILLGTTLAIAMVPPVDGRSLIGWALGTVAFFTWSWITADQFVERSSAKWRAARTAELDHQLQDKINDLIERQNEMYSQSQEWAAERRALYESRPLNCPTWCQTNHAVTDKFERYADPVMDLRTHTHTVAEIPNPGAGRDETVSVDVAVTDDLTADTREGPVVQAWSAESMTPDTARQVALALWEGAALVSPREPFDRSVPEVLQSIERKLGEHLNCRCGDKNREAAV